MCGLEIGFSNPPTCLFASCPTPGTYPSSGSCERKFQLKNPSLLTFELKLVLQDVQVVRIHQPANHASQIIIKSGQNV